MSRASGNFLVAYGEYTQELEAPETYHLWVGLSILASAVRRNVWIDQGMYIVYPNLYVTLVAPPGKLGKSTCIRAGRKILSSVEDIIMGPDSVSSEELIRFMAKSGKDKISAAVTIHSSEISSLIDTSGLKMIQFLTDIYDCEDNPHGWRRATKTAGSDTINNPVLNVLAGTTPSWIAESMPIQATDHGYTSRTIFIYEESPRFANPRPSAPDPKLVEALKTDIKHIAQIEGIFEWTDESQELYDTYYKKWLMSAPDDHRIAGYFNRKRTHVLKIAQLIHLAEDDDLVIEKRDIETAVQILGMIEASMPKTFAGVGKYAYTADTERILSDIVKHNGLPLFEIFRRNAMVGNAEDVYKLVRTLVKMKRIKVELRGKESWAVPFPPTDQEQSLDAD